MDKTIGWINKIIEELVDPLAKLKDTLLKVQVLAFKIKNPKLKDWVDKELNGFVDSNVPEYRKISTAIFGNLEQNRGFAGLLTRHNSPLPIEYLPEELYKALLTVGVDSSVAELELLIQKNVDCHINIPYPIHIEITKILENNWIVTSAWKKINLASIEGILSSIKSKLLTFLLELAEEIGEGQNINFMEHKKKIDNLFDKTIGQLSGETINISIGTDNIQSVNTGEKSMVNVAKGKHLKQTIKANSHEELKKFISELKLQLETFSLPADDNDDILNEIARIETQLQRTKPKYPIINEALKIINGIFIGVAGNAMTSPILDNLGRLIHQFTS